MNLWIRSQDKKTLVKNDYITIMWFPFHYSIVGYLNGKIKHKILGSYKTQKRATEVLDEIQKLLQPIYKVTNDFKKSELTGNCQWIEKQEYIPIQTKVYQMPEN